MPSLVKIKIERGRDLPPMDRNAGTDSSTDAYVEIKVENYQQRTNTCRRTLNPIWNEEFEFEFIDDSVMQDEPLELKCYDQDLYSSDLIGVTYVDLNPLIMRTTSGEKDLVISGWFPLFDTARGMRGALYVVVKLQFIGNENQFKDSSAGIQFFSSSTLSSKCFFVQEYIGFVEDLVIQDDQENSWQDYFKGNKTSNDSRLKALYSLSAEARRKLGRKVYECGGNAVLGYTFHLDTEGSSTIVARVYGTACKILKVDEAYPKVEISRLHLATIAKFDPEMKKLLKDDRKVLLITRECMENILPKLSRASSPLAAPSTIVSDSLILLRPTGEVVTAIQLLTSSSKLEKPSLTRDASRHNKNNEHLAIDWINIAGESTNMFQGEVQLLTLKKFPSYVQVRLGGLVLARSVKYLGHSEGNNSDSNTRLEWWKELRDEIKAHAKVLCCHSIIGYSETCTIFGDICILSAIGTAAEIKGLSLGITNINLNVAPSPQVNLMGETYPLSIAHSSPQRRTSAMSRETTGTDNSQEKTPLQVATSNNNEETPTNIRAGISRGLSVSSKDKEKDRDRRDSLEAPSSEYNTDPDFHLTSKHMVEMDLISTRKSRNRRKSCAATHIPYNHNNAPFAFMRLVPCLICKRKWVPETILTTTELPSGLSIKGKGRLLEAKVCRPRKALNGESDAVKVSEVLPFVEYDLQRQIILKLKVLGMNAAFGYTCQIEISNDIVVATALCTAVFANSLPAPSAIQIMRNREVRSNDQELRLAALQREIEELTLFNAKVLNIQNEVPEFIRRRRSGSKGILDVKLFEAKLTHFQMHQAQSPGQPHSPNLISNGDFVEGIISKDDADSHHSSRSRSSSSSSSSTESSSSDSYSDGDDSTSLASPSSSSSSSSSSESGDEDESSSDDQLETTDAVTTKMTTNPDPSVMDSNSKPTRPRSHSAGSKKSDFVDTDLASSSKKKINRPKSVREDHSVLASSKYSAAAGTVTDANTATNANTKTGKKKKEKKVVYKDDRLPFILEIDDESDADILSVLQDWIAPTGIDMVNVGKMPSKFELVIGVGRQVTVIRRGRLFDQRLLSSAAANNAFRTSMTSAMLISVLNRLFQEAYLKLCFTVKNMIPCQILNITHYLNVIEDGQVEIVISAMVHKVAPKLFRSVHKRAVSFQESDCSDVTESGKNYTPTKDMMSMINNNIPMSGGDTGGNGTPNTSKLPAASPSAAILSGGKDSANNTNSSNNNKVMRSQSLDFSSRGRAASNGSSDSYAPGGAMTSDSLNDSLKTEDDMSSSFHSLAVKSGNELSRASQYPSASRLETIEETSVFENGQVPMKERSRASTSQFSSAVASPRMLSSNQLESASATNVFSSMKGGANTASSTVGGSVDGNKPPHISVKKPLTGISHVILTPLFEVPGAKVKRYLGPVQLHFIKDFWAVRGEGTLGSFFYLFMSEVNAAARTHVAALGGNALLCHRLVPQEAGGKVSRSQGYTMFSISGDAVLLEFFSDSPENEEEGIAPSGKDGGNIIV